MKPIRVYADTSVFGGVFDPEFTIPSRAFFDQVNEESDSPNGTTPAMKI